MAFERAFPVIETTRHVLANGLRLVLAVDRTAPIIASFVHYHVGSKNERPDRTGFAHFFEHLMFEGTRNIERHQIDRIVQSAGGSLNAFTSADETGYDILLPSNQLELALWIESERMMHARVEDIGVETQRSVVKEERRVRYENTPYGSLREYLFANAFKGTTYEWTPIGSSQYIDRATTDEFREFYKTYYVPGNAVLSIAGDIDEAKTIDLVESYFGDIPSGAVPSPQPFALSQAPGEIVVDVIEQHTPAPSIVVAFRGPARGSDDLPALEMLTAILAGGTSSRMHRTLVEESRMSLVVQTANSDLELASLWSFASIATPMGTVEAMLAEVLSHIDAIATHGPTERERMKVLNTFEMSLARCFDDVLDKATELARYETFHGDPNRINLEFDRYSSVTCEDVRRVADRYFVKDNRIVLAYRKPPDSIGRDVSL